MNSTICNVRGPNENGRDSGVIFASDHQGVRPGECLAYRMAWASARRKIQLQKHAGQKNKKRLFRSYIFVSHVFAMRGSELA
jgi:hypothetical protein